MFTISGWNQMRCVDFEYMSALIILGWHNKVFNDIPYVRREIEK